MLQSNVKHNNSLHVAIEGRVVASIPWWDWPCLNKTKFWNTGGTLQMCDDDQTSPVPMVCWWIPLLEKSTLRPLISRSRWLPTANGPHMCRLFHSHCYYLVATQRCIPLPVDLALYSSAPFWTSWVRYRCSTASGGSYSQRWWARVSPFLKRNMFMGKQSPLIASVESNIGILISQEEVRCHVKLTFRAQLIPAGNTALSPLLLWGWFSWGQ